MIRRIFALLLIIPLVGCVGVRPPLPIGSTASTPQPSSSLIALPVTAVATGLPSADTPSSVTTFPNPDSYTWQLIVSGLKRPISLQPDGAGTLFIAENPGRIRIFKDGQLSADPFLDIDDRVDDSGNEQGLLGLAFHPQYSQNRFFYVDYTDRNGDTIISRFHADGDVADPNSEKVILKIKQPFGNHNGGQLAFGPDDYLYIATGDGGSSGDPFGNAQNTNVLLGKILRVDVDSSQPYAIPTDNPFGNEVYFYGLRNPWRFSFDQLTHDLFIGDVGQNKWEEIDYVPAGTQGGLNFGWNYYEGNHDYKPQGNGGNFTFPVAEYSHEEGGCSIIGGYVYRGAMVEWNGVYLYGDYCTGFVWGLINSNGQWQPKKLFETGFLITSFGQDESGTIFLLTDGGEVYILAHK